MQLYPRAMDLFWPGHVHGTGCLSARAMDTGFRTVVWHLCLGFGCCGNPANPGSALGCVCLGTGLGFAPPFLAGVCGVCTCAWVLLSPRQSLLGWWGVCVCAHAPLASLHCWLGFVVRLFRQRFWLYPAPCRCGVLCSCVCVGLDCGFTPQVPAWVLGCVCLCACSASGPPFLDGVCGVGVSAWALVWAAPHHSWQGFWSLRLCARSAFTHVAFVAVRFWASNPPNLAEVVGRVCLCARSACTLPFLARVCGLPVCARVRVSAAPRHSWLGCWGVCACVHAPPVARQSWLGSLVCVSGFGFWLSPRQSWLGCWAVCVGVRAPPVPRQSRNYVIKCLKPANDTLIS